MSRESLTRVVVLALFASALAADRAAYGVDPNALESAYWRFEEGVAGANVPAPVVGNVNQRSDVVDSANGNHMQAFDQGSAPKYVDTNLPPTNLASGQPNTLALQMDGGSVGGRDIFSIDRQINNGIVGGMYDSKTPSGIVASTTTGFTLEAAFSVSNYANTRTIIAKEGLPGRAMSLTDPVLSSLPTMALKVRGADGADAGKLQIELFDGAGNLRSVMTDEAVTLGQWYYAAVVNDGSTLSLYLDSNDGDGYQLVGSQGLTTGALFQGLDHNNASWDKAWSIGKGVYGWASGFDNGVPADFFNGEIDEVRLTNHVLDPTEFLFYQEPTGLDGDFNGDEVVDGADFLEWQRGNSPNGLNSGDLQLWKDNFGETLATIAGAPVPEPATWGMAALAAGAALLVRRRRS